MTSLATWVQGARPRTLPAAVVPVAIGTATVWGGHESVIWWRALAALVVALALQVATNYANDYSDGVRGTDADDRRVGPVRLVGQGLAEPRHVKLAAFAAFGVAGLAGLALAVAVGWQLLVVGVAAIAAGWFYTGGSRPYGYAGFGELFVFVFFGVVATAGSAYVHTASLDGLGLALAISVPVGFLATALLVVNNLRDIPGDSQVGKNTLAVRLGDCRTRLLYVGLVGSAPVLAAAVALACGRPWGLLGLLGYGVIIAPIRSVLRGARGKDLISVLGATGQVQLLVGALLTVGLAIR